MEPFFQSPARLASSCPASAAEPASKRARQISSPSHSLTSTRLHSGRHLVINELLCFMFKKYNQLNVKVLKQIITDFYDGNQVNAAKEMLFAAIESLNLSSWNKPPKRRKDSKENPMQKIKNEVDDLLAMVVFIDENAIHGDMPIFVAADPDAIPSPKLTEGDLQCMLAKMNGLPDDISQVHDSLNKTTESMCLKLNQILDVSSREVVCHRAASGGGIRPPLPPGGGVELPGCSGAESYPLLSPMVNQQSGSDDHLPSFSEVLSKNRKRQANAMTRVAQQSDTSRSRLPSLGQAPRAETGRAMGPTAQRQRSMIGASVSSTLKASKHLTLNKAFFRLGNIDANYECEDVVKHIQSIGVRLISCFELPKRDFIPVDNKQFRICILAVDKDSFLNPAKWSIGITIKEWVFKQGKHTATAAATATTTTAATAAAIETATATAKTASSEVQPADISDGFVSS